MLCYIEKGSMLYIIVTPTRTYTPIQKSNADKISLLKETNLIRREISLRRRKQSLRKNLYM